MWKEWLAELYQSGFEAVLVALGVAALWYFIAL
jgi:hypothetical protein